MKQLTLENIAWYLPYGVKFISDMDKPEHEYGATIIHTCNGIIELFGDMCLNSREYSDAYALQSCKPILLPMSDLTKTFIKDGEETTHLQELLKLLIKSNGYYLSKDINGNIIAAVSNNGYKLQYIDSCIFVFRKESVTLGFDLQLIVKYLAKEKFDFKNFIAENLAIDANTLQTNPYL